MADSPLADHGCCFRQCLGLGSVMVALREICERYLHRLPAPLGLVPPHSRDLCASGYDIYLLQHNAAFSSRSRCGKEGAVQSDESIASVPEGACCVPVHLLISRDGTTRPRSAA